MPEQRYVEKPVGYIDYKIGEGFVFKLNSEDVVRFLDIPSDVVIRK